jgi:hypothetical protein
VEKTAVFGTERLLGYCGGSHHRILLFIITLDSHFTELSEEASWVEGRVQLISENSIEKYSEFDKDQRFILQF